MELRRCWGKTCYLPAYVILLTLPSFYGNKQSHSLNFIVFIVSFQTRVRDLRHFDILRMEFHGRICQNLILLLSWIPCSIFFLAFLSIASLQGQFSEQMILLGFSIYFYFQPQIITFMFILCKFSKWETSSCFPEHQQHFQGKSGKGGADIDDVNRIPIVYCDEYNMNICKFIS